MTKSFGVTISREDLAWDDDAAARDLRRECLLSAFRDSNGLVLVRGLPDLTPRELVVGVWEGISRQLVGFPIIYIVNSC